MSNCPICFEQIKTMKDLFETKECTHYFHNECIFQWSKHKGSQDTTCPMCRHIIDIKGIRLSKRTKLKMEKHYKQRTWGNVENESDIYRHIHDTELCTIIKTGQEMRNQMWFNCKTCDLTGNHGICEVCRVKCHAGHDVVSSPNSPSLFRCCCGNGECKNDMDCKCLIVDPNDKKDKSLMYEDPEDSFIISYRRLEKHEHGNIKKLEREKKCTFTATGRNYVKQSWWRCLTCSTSGKVGVCKSCMDICHKGHKIEPTMNVGPFFCDCGAKLLAKVECKCLKKKRKRESNEDELNPKGGKLRKIGEK